MAATAQDTLSIILYYAYKIIEALHLIRARAILFSPTIKMGSRKTNHPRLTASDLHSPEFNHLYMYGEVTKESVNRLNASIETFERPVTLSLSKEFRVISTAKPIMLHINSGGGDSSAVISAVRNIRNSKVPVYTIVDGIAMSAAADILLAGHVRYAYPDALVLMHQHWELVRAIKRHEDNVVDSKVSTAYYEQYKRYYLANSKLDGPGLDKLLARDRYLTAPECKKLGLVDDVIIPPASATLKAFAKDNYESMSPGELLAAADPKPGLDINRRLNVVPIFSHMSHGEEDDDDDGYEESEQRIMKDPERMCLFAVQAISLINKTMTTTIMSPSRGGVNSFTGYSQTYQTDNSGIAVRGSTGCFDHHTDDIGHHIFDRPGRIDSREQLRLFLPALGHGLPRTLDLSL